MSPVVTFSHVKGNSSQFCFATINAKPILRSSPPSQSSWQIHSHKHSFTSACYSFNHNRNITSGDISVKMSPVMRHFHTEDISAFSALQQSMRNRYSDHPSISIQLTHPFTHAFIHFSMLFIHSQLKYHKWWHFSKNVTCRDIFTQGISAFLLCNNQCKTDTQIIPPSQSSWHNSPHMNPFTSASYSFNHERNITSGDISAKMSPVVTFSHKAFQPLCFANISAKPIIRSSLHLNPADTYISTHESIHFSKLFVQPQ